ncbi:MAG TPA: hypothetical protein VGA37_04070 [Gemmatimonadales bacterium]|jgi:uncharacterized protein involved in cysteine biosynthesis
MLLLVLGLVIIVALLIPILAVVLDSPFVHKMAESRYGTLSGTTADELMKRLQTIEDDVDDLGQAVRQLKEENQFLQGMLESAEEAKKLPPSG